MDKNYLAFEFVRLWGQGEALEDSPKHRDYDTDEVINLCRQWAEEYEGEIGTNEEPDPYDFFQRKFEALE